MWDEVWDNLSPSSRTKCPFNFQRKKGELSPPRIIAASQAALIFLVALKWHADRGCHLLLRPIPLNAQTLSARA